jgi:NAD(P)-dependent dehydrogenase (short-subunit alcohol dehydrogenase family)
MNDEAHKTVFILSLSSDIGRDLATRFLADGYKVVGTFRDSLPESLQQVDERLVALPCDITQPENIVNLVEYWQKSEAHWDIFISCVGQLAPIGSFFAADFSAWQESVITNSLAQLHILHALYPFRNPKRLCHVVLFAGGGTNSAFRYYSAYCLGKICLIKMCELLDDENPDLNIFIVGTGWVRTKIHQQTLDAGVQAGDNFEKTLTFYWQDEGTPEMGTSFEDIHKMILWGIAQGKEVVSGRNFSVVHDSWRDGGSLFTDRLRNDPAKFKLRRQGNEEKAW